MTDIVERLRVQSKEDHIRGCQGREYSCDCGYDLKTEGLLEMAADDIAGLRTQGAHLADALEAGRAEIERLKTQNDMIFTDAAGLTQAVDALAKANIDLRADNERLRAALQAIADYTPGKDTIALLLRGYARAALEQKP